LLAIAQFYHFAFLVVSLALLGFGASGTFLSVFPKLREIPLDILFPRVGIGFFISIFITLGVINLLPFDSYSIAWERRQILYFFFYYFALAIPFFVSGLGIGAALARSTGYSHIIYAANLIGSGFGAVLAPIALKITGVTGAVVASAVLALFLVWGHFSDPISLWLRVSSSNAKEEPRKTVPPRILSKTLLFLLLLSSCGFLIHQAALNIQGRAPLLMRISPYKSLAQALRYPGSKTQFSRWNAISRVDVVVDAGIHAFPGLSYLYSGDLPEQYGLSIDAEAIKPITLVQPSEFAAAEYLPESLAFDLLPGGDVLILEPAGGLGLLQALSGGVNSINTVISNELIDDAIQISATEENIYAHPGVNLYIDNIRSYLEKSRDRFDIIYLPLIDSYRPVMSGAYSLSEDYSLTKESFISAFSHLSPQGFLVATRWIQTPPSEDLRLITTIYEVLREQSVPDPDETLIAYRGIQTLTVMVKPSGWSTNEANHTRSFAEGRKYDLVWLPDIQPEEVNRFNQTSEPSLYLSVRELFGSTDLEAFYDQYPFDIAPPTDDHPFFFHFFTWKQAPEIVATIGKTWQPFGGSGYLILFAFLILAVILSFALIVTPILYFTRKDSSSPENRIIISWRGIRFLIYFMLLGVGFLFIEIPLIQRWILFVGHPTFAFTIVVLVVLLFSGFGSLLSRNKRFPKKVAFTGLVGFVLLTPLVIERYSSLILGYQPFVIYILSVLILAPMSFFMGVPFSLGLGLLEEVSPQLVPWAWAVNGCSSVIASVLAAILALGYSFSTVLLVGAIAYLGALFIFMVESSGINLNTTVPV
jgi:hypothetical protein